MDPENGQRRHDPVSVRSRWPPIGGTLWSYQCRSPTLRRPDEKAAIAVDRHFDGDSWLGLEWVYTGEREDFGGIELDSYHLVNLRGGWQFSSDWRLELRGENLADEDYEPAFGFNAPGRSWFLSLAWIP